MTLFRRMGRWDSEGILKMSVEGKEMKADRRFITILGVPWLVGCCFTVVGFNALSASTAPPPEDPAVISSKEDSPLEFRGPYLSPEIFPQDLYNDPRLEYDVLEYELSFEPHFEDSTLTAETIMRIVSLRALDEVVVDLKTAMVVSAAWLDSLGTPVDLPFSHENQQVVLSLPEMVAGQDTLTLGLSCEGRPSSSFAHKIFGSHGRDAYKFPIAATLSEPEDAHGWWACKDLLTDKALVSVHLTVPEGYVGVSNGERISTIAGVDQRTTSNWNCRYPMSTYLVSIAATNYVTWDTTHVTAMGDTIPLTYYAYPEDEADARADWAITGEAMTVLETLFGPYPFHRPNSAEGYGMAEFHWITGAEEHQTMTSYGSGFINGRNVYDHFVAHELSHQWFGDAVTLTHWEDMWTKEGLATYCEALYLEKRVLLRLGEGAEKEAARVLKEAMEARALNHFSGAVGAPKEGSYYSSTIYRKGAWVFHMLRRILGDDLFFSALANHYKLYKYDLAGTAELVRTIEETYGESLSWFFDPWLYEEGRPLIAYDWTTRELDDGRWSIHLHLEQNQTQALYRLPLDILLTAGTDSTAREVWLEGRWQDISLEAEFKPENLILDPYGWILADEEILPMTGQLRLENPFPQPSSVGHAITLRYFLPQSGVAEIDLIDVMGRRVGSIVSKEHPAGWQLMEWSGGLGTRSPAAGLYWLRLRQSGRTSAQKIILLE